MYRSLWNTFKESVCSINYYNSKRILFFRSSGFRYDNYIISVFCKEELERADYVIICFQSIAPGCQIESLQISINDFYNRLPSNLENDLPGILVLEVGSDEFISVPVVNKSNNFPDTRIGTSVATLSYSHKLSQLHIKTGIISSHLSVRGESFMFIEMSFEPGNPGSPLINAITGEVIGVIMDCFSSPLKNHKQLKLIINENIRILNDASGKLTFEDIDPVQVLLANQHMIKYLAREIFLFSQKNFGFAFPLTKIAVYLKRLKHINRITVSARA